MKEQVNEAFEEESSGDEGTKSLPEVINLSMLSNNKRQAEEQKSIAEKQKTKVSDTFTCYPLCEYMR